MIKIIKAVCLLHLQNTRISIYIFAGVVLLYFNDSWIDFESEWFTNQRLVAYTPFHFDGMRWRFIDLAARRTMATVSSSIYVFQCIHFDGTIFTVSLPKGRAVSAQSARWTAWHGHHHWRFSFVDVARSLRLTSIPLCWLHFPGLQLFCFVQTEPSSRRTVASHRIERSILYIICRKCSHHITCNTGKNSRTCQRTLSFIGNIQTKEGTFLQMTRVNNTWKWLKMLVGWRHLGDYFIWTMSVFVIRFWRFCYKKKKTFQSKLTAQIRHPKNVFLEKSFRR